MKCLHLVNGYVLIALCFVLMRIAQQYCFKNAMLNASLSFLIEMLLLVYKTHVETEIFNDLFTWARFVWLVVPKLPPVFPFELSEAKYVFKNHCSPSCPLLTRINKAWNVLFNLSFLGWKWKWNKFFRSLVFKIPVLTKIDWVVD